ANLVGKSGIAFGSNRVKESAEESLHPSRRFTDLPRRGRIRLEKSGPRLADQIERRSTRGAGFEPRGDVVERRTAVAMGRTLGSRHAVEDLPNPACEEDRQRRLLFRGRVRGVR